MARSTAKSKREGDDDRQPSDRLSKRARRNADLPGGEEEDGTMDEIVVASRLGKGGSRRGSEDPLALQVAPPSSRSTASRGRARTVVEVVVPAVRSARIKASDATKPKGLTTRKSIGTPTSQPEVPNRDLRVPSPTPSSSSSVRISSRVSRPSQRAIESGLTPLQRSRPLPGDGPIVSPSPLRRARGRHHPSPRASESASNAALSSQDDDSESRDEEQASFTGPSPSRSAANAKAKATMQQARFLENERTARAREARNLNWQGAVDEPRKLRGGKVVEVQENGNAKVGETGMDDDMDEEDEGAGKSASKSRKGKAKALPDELEDEGGGIEEDGPAIADDDDNPFLEASEQEDEDLELQYDDAPGRIGHLTADPGLSNEPIPIPKERLYSYARQVLRQALANLTPAPQLDPPPFPDEPSFATILPRSAEKTASAVAPELHPNEQKERMKKYEALGQLVALLIGTVSRGEGNSCLVLGGKGSGKTRTVNRALSLVSTYLSSSINKKKPIIVRLDGMAQTNDMLAIREMGRQIAIGEGRAVAEEEGEDEDGANAENHAPTTLPAHLLALLTQPSERAIVIVIDQFDLFTQHARQALLYCLLDVVQSVRPGSSATTGRGIAVVGVTSRVDMTLLLEKRVKSRFSQRVFRVASPLAGSDLQGGKLLLRSALQPEVTVKPAERGWALNWSSWVESVLKAPEVEAALQRLCDVTTDPQTLYKPFVQLVAKLLSGMPLETVQPENIARSFRSQLQESGWHAKADKLKALSQPALVVLIVAKHFSYAGKEEFNFAMAEHEYQRFAQSALAVSGRARWSTGILRMGWDQLLRTGLLFPATRFRPNPNPYMHKFLLCRSRLSRNEIVAYFKGDGAKVLGTELSNWGRTAGGHA